MTRRRPKDAATDKLPAADGPATEYLWYSMVDALRDPAFVHDAQFRILCANRPYAALAGMDGASVIGKLYWEVFPRRDGPLPACAAAMRSIPHCEVAEELSLESGQTFHSRSFALFKEDGSYQASVHILEDITERRRYEADLLYQKERLEEIERIFRLGTWEWDLENDRSRCSEQMCRLLGLTPDKGSLTYELMLQRVHADDRQRVNEAMQHTLKTGAAYDVVYRYLRPDGAVRIHHAAARAVTDAGGRARRIVGTCQDITETYEAEQRLKRLNRMYRTISRCNHLLIHAEDENVLAQRFCEALIEQGVYHMAWVGYAEQDEARSIRPVAYAGAEKGYLAGLNLTWADNERGSGPGSRSIREGAVQVTRDIRNDPQFALWREEALRRGFASSIALPLKTACATYGFLGIYSALADAFDAEEVELLTEAANDLAFGINTLRERAERDALSREVAYLSTHDRLTGLANRALLVDRLQQAMSYARRYEHLVAVVSLDLDSFKDVNDSLGTDAGDQFLKETARRLCTCVRDNDTVARVGSDEFVLVVTGQKDTASIGNLLTQILAALREPVSLCEREVVVTASIGCSLFPSDGEDHEVLLRRANVAKYRAKDSGHDAISFFAAGLDVAAAERVALEADLRRALPRQELLLHYQPQVDLRTGTVIGVEALLRWRHPQRGMVSPSLFIPVAEKTGMILQIGDWVLGEACRQMKAWCENGLKLESIAVNLAGSQFFQKDLPHKVKSVLGDTGLEPGLLELELTESMLMEDIESTLDTLVALKRLGVRLSLDDFGTGYSSLSYLRRFPIDALKIDRSFVGEITTDPSSLAIVDAIIALAHSMRLPVIAEGVETEGQLAALRARGCDQLQGYLFAKPLPPDELAKLVAERRTLALPEAEEADGNRTLLIVDDDDNVLSALKRLLRRDGYDILTARSGEEGMEVLAKHKAGVIMSDQRMDGMTGKEFLHRAMAMYPDSVRMILSGYTDLNTVMDAVNMGHIYKFISKPWNAKFLRACVKDAFDMYSKQRSAQDERQR